MEEIQQNYNISKPMIAGILLIIAGIVGILSYVQFFVDAESQISLFIENLDMTIDEARNILTICGSVGIILSIISILGGILSYKRKKWGIAISCGIIGIFAIGDLFISSVLCFIAILLLTISKDEFIKK